jgi:hypothetical protein
MSWRDRVATAISRMRVPLLSGAVVLLVVGGVLGLQFDPPRPRARMGSALLP